MSGRLKTVQCLLLLVCTKPLRADQQRIAQLLYKGIKLDVAFQCCLVDLYGFHQREGLGTLNDGDGFPQFSAHDGLGGLAGCCLEQTLASSQF